MPTVPTLPYLLTYLTFTEKHLIEGQPKKLSIPPRQDSPHLKMPHNRSVGRDVWIFDRTNRSTPIGGLILTAGVTKSNLHAMIEIFVVFHGEYVLRNETDIAVEKDDTPLVAGNYYVDSRGMLLSNMCFYTANLLTSIHRHQ
jgi:hypothetical protein